MVKVKIMHIVKHSLYFKRKFTAVNANRGRLMRCEPVVIVVSLILLHSFVLTEAAQWWIVQTCQNGITVVEAADYTCRHKTCGNV